jgi:uncharacterized phage-associated protein
MTALELSYYILKNQKDFSVSGITPLKLQKLLYYTYVWSLVANEKILADHFVKWQYGPVNLAVYAHYKKFGKAAITSDFNGAFELLPDVKKFVDFVLSNYIKYDAVTLSAMTHKDIPWREAPNDGVIDENAIKKFYSKLNFAKNFPIDESKLFYPIETDLHYAYILDMPKTESEKPVCFNSYAEYLELEEKNQKDFEKKYNRWFAA